ncbi:MAG: universal stress protein [Nitrosopumilus sp.]|nr:universal stress protein [Nitrosopumilus sp.]
MYKKILIPHAGTPAGDEALRHAIHIAKTSSSKIILLHIVEAITYPPSFALSSSERKSLFKSIDDANESIKKDMEKEMEKRKELCKESDLESEIIVTIGNAAEIILDIVKEKKIDLIVMAKRRKLKGVKKLLSLGSVSRKVVENVNCPVVLIDIENL